VPDLDDTLLGGLLIAVIPALVVTLWYWLQYPKGREPTSRVILQVFLGGMACTLPVIPVQLGLMALWGHGGVGGLALEAFVAAGLLEELAKFAVLRWLAERHAAFTCVQDGLFYGVMAGNGFSLVEDLAYMAGMGTDVGIFRALFPFHVIWTGIAGYYVGLARFAVDPAQARRWRLQGLLMAVGLHGSWDLAIFLTKDEVVPALVTAPVAIAVWLASLYLLQRRLVLARRVDEARRQRTRGTGRLPA
jgi:RsiW-degrading membrane proteinase PrsW (M82 family)